MARNQAVLFLSLFVAIAGASAAPAQQKAPAKAAGSAAEKAPPVAQVTAEAVVVDIVVRDKDGRAVTDLKPEELEIYEDGVKQSVKSFGFVQQEIAFEQSSRPATPSKTAPPPLPQPAVSSVEHINLVTLAFDTLEQDGQRLAVQACEDFIKSGLHKNVFVSVFAISHRLHIVQQFTNDAEQIKAAVRRATGQSYLQYLDHSVQIERDLLERRERVVRGRPQSFNEAVEGTLAEVTLRSLQYSQSMEREQQAHASLYSLMGLVQGQRLLAGRKTVIYFSHGLVVPPNRVSLMRSVISEANRNNVSFYSVDASGLTSRAVAANDEHAGADHLGAMRRELQAAADISMQQVLAPSGSRVTPEQVMVGERAEGTLRMDAQGTLDDLARSTGGFLIANSNDLGVGVRRVSDDIRGYYEVTYSPSRKQYDGRFRAITVKVSRPDASVRSRSGYFALPPYTETGPVVSPFETPLLAALSAPTPAKDVEYHAQVLKFGPNGEGADCTLVMEVPMEQAKFEETKAADSSKTYQLRFGLLALVKDSSGQVIERFSQDYPVQDIPAEQLEAMKRGKLLFVRQLSLPPGRHTVETAVHEMATAKTGVKRSVLVVGPPRDELQISSLTLIRRIERLDDQDSREESPLVFNNFKIIPNLSEPIASGPNAKLSLYLVVYPVIGGERPKLTMEVAHNGVAMARGDLELPAPDSRGRIPYTAELPLSTLKPGVYEVRAIVTQDGHQAEEQALITLN